MKAVIDIVLLIIIALCTWGGYKRGLVGGIAAILAIVIALFGGSILSTTYAGEVVPALEPFVNGYMDSKTNREAILEKLGYGKSDYSLDDILSSDQSLKYDYAYECAVGVGLYSERAEEVAEKAVKLSEAREINMTTAVVSVLCGTVTYVGGLCIAFLLILILIVAIANIGNMSFRLPNMETLDEVGGALLGFAKGIVYCVLLCWLLSFFGIIIGKTTLEDTTLARLFLAFRFITQNLM